MNTYKEYNEELLKIVELFMEKGDDKALKELYKLTKDNLVKKVIEWRKCYSEEISKISSISSIMYNDVIEYFFEKYKLSELSKIEGCNKEKQEELSSYDY